MAESEQSLPELPPGEGTGMDPEPMDPEWDEYVAWLDREIAAGRDPDEDRVIDSAIAPLAGICDPDGPGGEGTGALFGQGYGADTLPPGLALAALTEQAFGGLGELSCAELIGVLQASRRLENREAYRQAVLIAEFARRREAAFEDAKARGVPAVGRPGGFPGEELAMELAVTRAGAAHRIEDAADLTTRLPATLAGMAAGLIDADRASAIAAHTRFLSDAAAAHADAVLAADAPDLRYDQLTRKAAALEMKLDPEAVKARKERAKKDGQRVELRREFSGNAFLAAREIDAAQAMASKAFIDAVAVKLRNGGLNGPLGALRVLAFGDLTQGRNPFDRLKPARTARPAPGNAGTDDAVGPRTDDAGSTPAHTTSPGDVSLADVSPGNVSPTDASPRPGVPGPGYIGPADWPGWDPDEAAIAACNDPLADELDDPARRAPVRPGDPVPLPALINILVPAGTLLGWSAAPAQAGTWGLLDRDETRDIVTAASKHPRTRWCITVIDTQGRAIAHGCARGQRPKIRTLLGHQSGHQPRASGQQSCVPGQQPGVPDAEQAARLAELLRDLNVTTTRIAQGDCDHAPAEDRYIPSRKLKHLVRARTATCDAPACNAQASYNDIDHTVPWPEGPTDQCNLGPKCRTHHRAKQAPDWKVEQPEPGVIRWTLPSGRVHITVPTTYDL